MAENATLESIGECLREHDSFVLLGHVRPDGDAIGSVIALGLALEAAGKSVRLLNEDGVPEGLGFLEGAERVERPGGEPVEAEVVIALDTANRARLGEACLAAVAGARTWINLDHHKSNERYGDLVRVDATSPATGQMVYQLIIAAGLPLPGAARDAIYTGVSTDTGSFRYPATTAETHEMVADLIRRGLDVGAINQHLYADHPHRRVRLLQALLETHRVLAGGRLAYWELDRATQERLGIRGGDSEGLIDVIRGIRGVVVALFFEELEDGRIRVSMRSSDPRVDVCRIAMQFGGGGHALAAGVRLPGPLGAAEATLIAAVESELKTLEN